MTTWQLASYSSNKTTEGHWTTNNIKKTNIFILKTMYLGTKMQYIAETTILSIVTLFQLRTHTLSYQGMLRGNKVLLNIYFLFYFFHHHVFPPIYFITLKVFFILRWKSYLIYFLREHQVYLALVTVPSFPLPLWVQLQ